MADEIKISNVGGEGGVASEVTLLRLINSMEEFAKKSGLDSKSQAAKAQKAYNDHLKKSSQFLNNFEDALEDNTDDLKKSSQALKKFKDTLNRGVQNSFDELIKSTQGFTKELLVGGNRLSDFTRHLPFAGNLLSSLTGFLDSSVDNLRDFSSYGAGFNNSIRDMLEASVNAQVPFDEFRSLITENSTLMQNFGGTVASGAREFFRLNRELRNGELGEQLFNLGFTMNDVNEGMLSYARLQARSGRLQRMNDQQLIEGTANYLENIDALAKVTGQQREQIQDTIAQNAAEANVAAMRSRLEGDALNNFDANLALVTATLPGFENAFKDLSDGVAQTDVGRQIAAIVPGFAALAEANARGEISQEEFARRMQELGPEFERFRDSFGGAGVSALMDQGFAEFMSGISQIAEFAQREFDFAEQQRQQAARSEFTERMQAFENTVAQVRTRIYEALINSGVFDTAERLMNMLFSDRNFARATGFINSMATSLENWLSRFNEDPWGTVQQSFTDLWEWMKDKFMNVMFGERGMNEYGEMGRGERQGGLVERISEGFRNLFREGSIIESVRSGVSNLFGSVVESVTDFWNDPANQERINSFFDTLTNMFRNMIDNLTGGGSQTPESISRGESFGGGLLGAATGIGQSSLDADVFYNQATRGNFDPRRILDEANIRTYLDRAYSELESSGVSSQEAKQQLLDAFRSFIESSYSDDQLDTMLNYLETNLNQRIQDLPQYSQGTQGFEDFGTGSLAMLHGMEAVVPLNSPLGELIQEITNKNNSSTNTTPTSQPTIPDLPRTTDPQSQETVANKINELNMTMASVERVLREIRDQSRRQIRAIEGIGTVQ